MNKLNLGCGKKRIDGYINVDNNQHANPDVVHDLEVLPYPFPDNYFSEIIMDHCLEHLRNPLRILQELYRIADNDCVIIIKCPHFSCNWFHPDHKTAISSKLFDFVRLDNEERYGEMDYQLETVQLSWLRPQVPGKRNCFVLQILNKIINIFANLNIALTERIWCYWVGGFEEIYFKVIVKKS